MKHLQCYILSIFLLLITSVSQSFAWQGKVVGVTDGDTITVMHDDVGENIRLYGVDSPEKRQPFGKKSKQFTSEMVFGEVVEVTPVKKDRYNRTVGIVHVDGKSLNEELVKHGFAWVHTRYCGKAICVKWLDLEQKAKTNKFGLWTLPDPTPPWQYRYKKRIRGY